jgi:hypothetical protein
MHDHDESANHTGTGSEFAAVLASHLTRRQWLRASTGAVASVALGGSVFGLAGCGSSSNSPEQIPLPAGPAPGKLGFTAVAPSFIDTVQTPIGYSWRVIYAWGDPISNGPAFLQDGSNSAADQRLQAGQHHDGMWYFPLPLGSDSSDRGLLVVNHEYAEPATLHVGGGFAENAAGYTQAKFDKEIAAHGVSIVEVEKRAGAFDVVRPSAFARRITADTPMLLRGPAAGDALLRTSADLSGTQVRGTLNNCGMGYTPWGTYLTCEENFAGYFDVPQGFTPPNQPRYARYGISGNGFQGYRWSTHDARFNVQSEPNEAHRHGWVVEIDPYDVAAQPIKRTALGRFAHEGAWVVRYPDNRIAVYSGDDARFEYVYKFVADLAFVPGNREANRNLLDTGTLYVAKFNADGSGQWLPLVHGQGALTAANGFASQAEVLIYARAAADLLGATKMDRPEWITADPQSRELFLTLTNNSSRTAAQVDAANPRSGNVFGHVLRFKEDGDRAAATTFRWSVFALAGDSTNADPAKRGTINGSSYGSPDGLWMDQRRVLWIQTDISESAMRVGDYANIGNNQMCAADPDTGETRRFLTGPIGCEVTGITMTPDGKTMFVNIQHPGDVPRDLFNQGVRLSSANPKAASSWPDGAGAGRPRSATLVITKNDGGVIGT